MEETVVYLMYLSICKNISVTQTSGLVKALFPHLAEMNINDYVLLKVI